MQTFLEVRQAGTRDEPFKNVCLGGYVDHGFHQQKIPKHGCHVVAQTQGYHLGCIWGSLVKFQGGGVVLKTMLFARVRIF